MSYITRRFITKIHIETHNTLLYFCGLAKSLLRQNALLFAVKLSLQQGTMDDTTQSSLTEIDNAFHYYGHAYHLARAVKKRKAKL